MKLCIPLGAPLDAGESDVPVEPHFPRARHLYLFDTETRRGRTLDLQARAEQGETFRIEAVLCASIDRKTLSQLLMRGIKVYGTDAETVRAAIKQYESGALEAVDGIDAEPAGCGRHGAHHEDHAGHGGQGCGGACGSKKGGCGGHGQAQAAAGEHEETPGHAHGAGACGGQGGASHGKPGCGGACGGAGRSGHGSQAEGAPRVPSTGTLRIAVCSQNRKSVTDHAGKCRKFWVFEVHDGLVQTRQLIELALEQSWHATPAGASHPLDGIDVLIAGSMGAGLQGKLRARGIVPWVTREADLEAAVARFLAGELPEPGESACSGGCGGH